MLKLAKKLHLGAELVQCGMIAAIKLLDRYEAVALSILCAIDRAFLTGGQPFYKRIPLVEKGGRIGVFGSLL
ncbi:hypothetical protein CLDAP_14580 [Caldilinea aerophila DSM 14535 = NBRC 104270]|uniref:Uncharacterized protein n=1 Tax=Caldilinea aerophila (strain DSM 14535 / JCM 11387 / NBRC 104270 / STL-6-O1) TaxID=926550 RepID=I0I2L0_CALAS|nr:hypothetical protein CLDAP_14580 [Caldilinea aerophila DSM 14535 = NBRC 104270]